MKCNQSRPGFDIDDSTEKTMDSEDNHSNYNEISTNHTPKQSKEPIIDEDETAIVTQLSFPIVCIQLNGFKYCYRTLITLFNINHLFVYSNNSIQHYSFGHIQIVSSISIQH